MIRQYRVVQTADINKVVIEVGPNYIFVGHSKEKMVKAKLAYDKGALIQEAFHFLSLTEREFLMTGYTPKQQEVVFAE